MIRASQTDDGALVAGTYRVLGRLGSGSMGEVFEAEHVRLGSRVAVKFLRDGALAEPRAVSRFQSEARVVAGLQCERVVRVFDCGELADGTQYLVMERLLGEDLRSLLARAGPLPVPRAVRLAIDACQGLAAVHAAGVVHRDLKPANLFVTRSDANPELCKLLDFGVAKTLASGATQQGHLLGTVRYMAPEQIEDAASATHKSDVYALGAILYEALTGSPVHAESTWQKTMFEILNGDVRPLSEFRAVPLELERVVLRALSKLPTDRPSARELGLALGPFASTAGDGAATLADESLDGRRAEAIAPRSRGRTVALASLLAATFGLGLLAGRAFDAAPPRSADAPVIAVPPVALAAAPAAPASLAGNVQAPVVPESTAPKPGPAVRAKQLEDTAKKGRDAGLSGRFDAKNPYAD